jgi:surface antigen
MQNIRAKTAALLLLVAAGGSLLFGCTNRQYATPEEAIHNACSAFGPKALSGTLIGGAVGAAGGAAIGAAAGGGKNAAYGALAGLAAGLIVGAIAGNTADKKDCQQAHLALQRVNDTPTGVRVAWANGVSGSYGAFTPVTDERTVNGHVCRDIRSDYFIKDHQPVVGEPGLVCRTADGDWARVEVPAS